MPHKEKSGRATNGNGSIRRRTKKRKNGTTYSYWEGRATTGFDSQGNQQQVTVTGKTKAEVAQKLREISVSVDTGTYRKPVSTTLNEWLTTWLDNYMTDVKDSTIFTYQRDCDIYIRSELGTIPLKDLSKAKIQKWLNGLYQKGLSEKMVKCVFGVLHKSLADAVTFIDLAENPSDKCKLKKVPPPKLTHLENDDVQRFLREIDGKVHERLYKVALFTGMREGEVLGLTWDCVDFEEGTITVDKQLCRERSKGGAYYFSPPKDEEYRTLYVPQSVMELLKEQRRCEMEKRAEVGDLWEGKNMVFSNPTGGFLSYRTVYDCFKRVMRKLGLPGVRFHDLRHVYAALSLQAGDDVRTLQGNLGHATPEFSLRVYAYVNQEMKKQSAARMEKVIGNLAVGE